ncbi:nucleotidyltransferase family protein [Galdieria sulphuraria]|uniref:Nucleotidyltransferase family protein n=1 Tax=Galdieria sulphuraria TaxID=130081 RepID=M2XLA5_GALSU|nr:nucleotidyltransferase family protein [Galdieria sulphuraria]EME30937.1 nucleotidyltransferase family protein [Galdieria sulphuraria]|eukprot:XP_005707457.1 nucleotidyltransferase family protein [Galdieria sulphuraria]
MRKENTRVDAALNEETMFSKKNELEPKNEPCLTHKSNTSEASENSETHEPDKDTSVDKKIGMEDELVLKKLSRVAVSSKPGGAWAAGPPSSMLHDTNLERSEAPSQHKSPQVETKEVTIESADRSRESQFSEKTKQETGKSKEQSHLKGSSKSSPVSSTSKQTTPRSFNSVGRETVTNGNIGHSKSDALSSSWPVLGTMGQPLSVVSPGAGPYATVLNSQKPGEGDDSNVREWKKQKDVNLGSEVGSESSKYSPFLTNCYHSVQYPFYSYPSPYMPMQNMFFPPWLLYPYAPPVAFPRPRNISGAYASNAHLHDGDQQKESNNMVNSKVPFSVQHTHGGNLSHGESTSDSQNAQKQDGMEAQKDLKVTKKDNLQPYGGAEKSPKGSSSTNGKNTFSPLVASPPPFGSFPGSFEKSQSMAAFYSPWPMMTPPFFWFPDPRMIDPYQTVTETALYLHQRIRPTKDESIRKASLFRHLYKLCQNEWKHCDLWMFGSSINSFGLRSGDLDMCLTVPSEDAIHRVTGERLEERHIVNRLGVILRQAKMENVECRFRARVPIVKFHDPLTRLSVDVCINNKLARHNSALLRTYASLDPRVQVLGLLIKYWAKCRGINQPFTGTLSSYAYILLLIQFLQLRNKPLLPCLQQSIGGQACTVSDSIPKVFVDNCNVYFDTCITGYTSLLSSLNSESVGLLLTEFFGFYAYSFDYSKDVVSIRSGRLLTREEKDWFVPPLDARIEESDEEDEHVSLDNHNATTSPLDSHADIFPHDMAFVHREPHDKVGQKAISDEEGIKHTNSSVLSPKMPVMNIWRMPKKHKRFKELHVFCIEDPFDTSHDIGRVVDEDSLEVLREEFIRAYEVIRTTGNFLEVCRPYEPEVTS